MRRDVPGMSPNALAGALNLRAALELRQENAANISDAGNRPMSTHVYLSPDRGRTAAVGALLRLPPHDRT